MEGADEAILGRIVKAASGVRNHPDEDIQILVFDLMVLWCTLPAMRKYLVNDIKGILMIVFGGIKSEQFSPKMFLSKIEHILKFVYFDIGDSSKQMRVNVLLALD